MRLTLLAVALLPACTAVRGPGAPGVDAAATVDFGQDLGQNFGTLFEARTDDGRLVFGAGFVSVFNTRHRGERYKVQFFVRPPEGTATGDYAIAPLPRLTEDTGVYVYGLGDAVYGRSEGEDRGRVRRLNDSATAWDDVAAEDRPGFMCATVRGKTLESINGRIVYDGKVILDQPEHGKNFKPYYGQGYLCFYHRVDPTPEGNGGFNSVVAVPWSPYADDLTVDMSQAQVLEVTIVWEFPYGWGQLGDEVLNCSNYGGFYAFDVKVGEWRVLVAPDTETSYQIYSMINYHQKLYMAQYPTGVLFEYDGRTVTTLTNWPPVMSGASTAAREAQTTQIYRGELLVGVWPWAELWRHDPDTGRWVFMQRMLTHPPVHDNPVHAYEKEATAAGFVLNCLGQRLTSMVPLRDALIVGTSSKGANTIAPEKLAFMTPAQRDEYGMVHRLHMPGNLAAVMTWKDKPTTLRFVAKHGRMAIHQDGRELAAAPIDEAMLTGMPTTTIEWGKGVYGPLSATTGSTRLK